MASTPVQKELRNIAADYRRYQILRGLTAIWAAAGLIGLLFLGAYWAVGLYAPYIVPVVLALSAVATLVVFWRNSRTDVTLREIARLIERDDPRLNTLLLAAAEQEPDSATGELNFLQTRVIREAIEANRRNPWNQRFSERLVFAQTAHLVTLCLFAAILLGCAFMAPRTSRTIAASGTGVEITPGNVTVEKGSTVAVLAKFRGTVPGEVHLVYQSAGGEEKKLAMARSLSDPLFGVTLPSLLEKTLYRIEYPGGQSERFTADVFEYPELKRADAELKFPEYTGFAASKIEDTRRVSAVEGTDVNYTFYLNKPVRSARLVGTNATQIVLTNRIGNAVQYSTEFALMESGQFKLELVDQEGRTNKIAPDFVFVALENQRPRLKLKAPRGDQRVSALEEVAFNAQVEDDFGLAGYGLAYRMAGEELKTLSLAEKAADKALLTKPHESREFAWMLALEKLAAEPGQLVTYYLWADDLGPDGKPRRTESDIYLAEVRPFEEIFREGNSGGSQQQQQQQGQQNPATKLLELQKEIISATWNLQRRENVQKPGPAFKKDAEVVRDSQQKAWQQAEELKERLRDEKSHAIIEHAITAMDSAAKNLGQAVDDNTPRPLPQALEFEQSAYQALLRLQAREYQVSRSRSNSGQQRNGGEQRAQRQLDQLELRNDENRYETESQASPLQSQEQRESLQVLNRLKELARRQADMSERLKELQSALNEARTQEEREKLERMLKRLQEEQQQIVQDTDELRQRMAQAENQSRMAEARQQLDQVRQQSREAAQQLQESNLGQALSSSARAQKQLQDLSEQFRKSTANQFAEQMRNMRQEARELSDKHEELQQKLEETAETRQRTLSNEGPKQELADALARQSSAFTNILNNMRQVTEQAEAAEPLLSRQLYETWRKVSQAAPEKNLQVTSQALDRNLMPLARDAYKRNEQAVRDLREGIEQAAEGVLGDEAESLRFAQKELEELAERVQQELNRAQGRASTASTNGGTNALAGARGAGGTNAVSAAAQADSTNRLGQAQLAQQDRNGQPGSGQEGAQESGAQENENGEPSPGSAREGQEGQPRQLAANSGQRAGPGQRQPGDGSSPGGQQTGERSGQGEQRATSQQASAQQGQGQQNNEANQEGGRQQASAQNGQPGRGQPSSEQRQPGTQAGRGEQRGQPGQQGQPGGQPQNGSPNQPFFQQWANGGEGGGANSGDRFDGPLTGRDFTAWSDRLRDVEEVLQNPQLRNEAARILDRARAMRLEYKRHAAPPQWDLVDDEVIKPMRILQNRVVEELARFGGRDAVVPVDRDPVPQKYTDLVSRYYERLGKD